MKCPKCQSDTGVIETRPYKENTIRRRRKCQNAACGWRGTTEEALIVVVNIRSPKAATEAAMALAQMRRQRDVEARRKNEERTMMRDLGLTDNDEGDL